MFSFYDKNEFTFNDINSLINNEVEESIHLDYKEAKALDKSDGKRKDISKDVSSFANSDGGIIIYGIKEENHKAHSITFINGNEYTKEWLEQIINSSIQRRIPDLKIFPLRKDGNIEQTVYLVKIPKSIDTPHLSKDKRFYKRFNFESVPMEEYEIRQLYGQKIKSKLVIGKWSITLMEPKIKEEEILNFLFEATIANDGDIVESVYKLNVYINNFNEYLNIYWPSDLKNYDYTWIDDTRIKLSSTGVTPIFPSETINVIRFNIKVSKKNITKAFKDTIIEISLFYPNGVENYITETSKMINEIQI
ncbi:MAG: helix-turn-helix domain-containing protein [Bacteroidales bacterium]